MPLTRLAADTLGVVTIVLVFLLALFGLYCIFQTVYFQLRIQRGDFVQLGYFNGPWITRIALVLVVIWWGLWEIGRLTLLKEMLRHFSSLTWQKNVCRFYILSNLGFAEPSIILTLVILLHGSLQKRESGTLSRRWNRKTILHILFFCLPVLIMQLGLIFVGPKFNKKIDGRTKMSKYFINTSFLVDGDSMCTYPLFSTAFLGLFDAVMISYALYIGAWLLSLVINKGLQRRIYWLISSIVVLLPLRVILLGCSVFLHPGSLAFEAVVFLAFFMLLLCATVSIWLLVYCPLADSLVLRDLGHMEIRDMPYDDYYHQDRVSLVASQSHLELGSHLDAGRSSDSSTKRGSISFRAMIRDDDPPMPEGIEEASFSHPAVLHIASPSRLPSPSARPALPVGSS